MKLLPVEKRILVKRQQTKEKTSGGIYIPDSVKNNEALVYASAHPELQEGDVIILGEYTANEFEYQGEKFLILDASDVMAKVVKE